MHSNLSMFSNDKVLEILVNQHNSDARSRTLEAPCSSQSGCLESHDMRDSAISLVSSQRFPPLAVSTEDHLCMPTGL